MNKMKLNELGYIVGQAAPITAIKSAIICPAYAGILTAMNDSSYGENITNLPFMASVVAGIAAVDLGHQYFKYRKEKKKFGPLIEYMSKRN